jgi:oxygen-independent coproporphyrinogen-3 oxidase
LDALSAYIHIPFCTYKCDFCDFTAFAGLDHLSEEYGQIVCQEISDRLKARCDKPLLNSIFYGGGTPGLVAPAIIAEIDQTLRQHALVSPEAEVTLETTPHSISLEKAKAWLDMGINRISIGIQSLSDLELKAVGRDHTRAQALSGIDLAVEAGFTNISTDLMYGLPEQTLESWQLTLNEVLELGLPHLSAYGLQLSTNSPLSGRYPRDSPAYPTEEQFVEFYHVLTKLADAFGLEQYEISNFSRSGFESTHNLSYWSNNDYFAFGVGAHRYVDGARSANWRSLKRYMTDWLGDELYEQIDASTRIKEAIFLALRTRRGIDLSRFERQYGVDLFRLFNKQIKRLTEGGLLESDGKHLWLTQPGVLVSNLVMAEFM